MVCETPTGSLSILLDTDLGPKARAPCIDKMADRKISIWVPSDFDVPAVYMERNVVQTAMALKLGAESVALMENSVREQTDTEAIQATVREFEAKLKAEKSKAEGVLRAANLRIEALESSLSTQRVQMQKDVRESVHELLQAKDDQILRLQKTLETTVDGMGRRVESLQQSITKTFASSKEKGSLGEVMMEGYLKRAYDCDVQVVSKGSETADIRMTRASGAYFWEIKNYTRMVSTEEVQKFRRDLRLHPDVRGGILVSLRQGIVGRSRGGDIDLEFLEDGRFILFLSSFMGHEDPVFYLQTLRPFFDTIEAMAKPVKEEAEAVRALEQKAALMTNLLRSHALSITRHKNSLVGHKKRTDAMFAEFNAHILESESQLQTVLKVAMGGDADTAAIQADSETTLMTSIFLKGTVGEFAEVKARDFVKWFLGITEVHAGAQIEVKDLIEKGRKEGFSEKWVRGAREDIFQETAWPKGGRFLAGVRLR